MAGLTVPEAVDYLLARAVRFEALAIRNGCHDGWSGPSKCAYGQLDLAIRAEIFFKAGRESEAISILREYGLAMSY